ncbi:hypothetical protein K450DRAFT_236426 [Umbelopsis ramanniana AG]|uniref:BRCT domain-containing protein n=1 Tax=Umbelopsis ramanniana AG TaxID=1314678 RepID=A0AAD5ECD7_UMBRA|nr:uncharacterized protein K450DRAFT_236426 [Umbelopsis ramanniana AG]KAI8580609.1 hypothetical protein K450DRAFT_236426 [Umbelopsis ramanniana AG]
MERAKSPIGRIRGESNKKPLFEGVKFSLKPLLDDSLKTSITQVLIENGAINADGNKEQDLLDESDMNTITHIISKDTTFAGYKKALENKIAVVTPDWINSAIRNGHVHRTQFYSPDPAKFFSGLVICTSGLTKQDREAILGGALAFGGDYRNDLTVDVTHLITMVPEGKKYETVMAKNELGIRTILPQWFYDCVKFQKKVDESEYLFPEPKLFEYRSSAYNEDNSSRTSNKLKESTANGYIHPYPMNVDSLASCIPSSEFMSGMKIYIHPDTGLSETLLSSLKECVAAAGASILEEHIAYSKEIVDIYIGRWRQGEDYKQASKDGKIVGSVWWLTNTLARNCVAPPTGTLLDYPMPKSGIKDMHHMVMTITNYNGVARDYVRRLIHALGATYTPNLTQENTHVISSSQHGQKYIAGKQWNLHVVNHLWLEDCFQQWTCKSVAEEKYVYFPDTHVLEDLVGTTALQADEITRWWNPEMASPMESALMNENTIDRHSVIQTPSSTTGHVKIVSKTARQAAITASNVLHEVMVPDMNAYQLEKRSSPKRSRQGSYDIKPDNETPSTPSKKKRQVSDVTPNGNVSEADQLQDATDSQPIHGNNRKSSQSLHRTATSESKNSDSQGVPTTPSKRKRQSSSQNVDSPHRNIRYVSSGKNADITESQKKQMNKLGAHWTEDIRDCTHLIVDRVNRTQKFMCAMNMGLHIVTPDWVKDSVKSGNLQEESDYQVDDSESEAKWGFSVLDSLSLARKFTIVGNKNRQQGTLLQGYEVFITKNTGPSKSVLKDIIESAGGKLLATLPPRKLRDASSQSDTKLIVLSCEADKDKCKDFIHHGIGVYDTELILTGCLRQSLDFGDTFRLPIDE